MKTYVEFRSDKFPAYEGESEFINPGIYGKRLAEFLAAGLKEQGFEPKEPKPEDWGWYLTIKNKGFRLWIGCANYAEYPDGFLCFIEPHKPKIFRLFRWIDTRLRVEALQQAMDLILSESAGIRDKKWSTFEEFNYPATQQ
ncbi:MAG: hypothetical protein ACE14V_01950 [bacterium]